MTNPTAFPWPVDQIARYSAYRTPASLTFDGRLDEPAWRAPVATLCRSDPRHAYDPQHPRRGVMG